MSKIKRIPTVTMVAVAELAYQRNGSILRNPEVRNGKIDDANRQLIKEYIAGDHTKLGEISDEQIAQAEEIITYLQQISMIQTLKKGQANDFLTQIVSHLRHDTIEVQHAGLVAWTPKLFADYKQKDQSHETISRFENGSKHFGKISEWVDINFTMIEKRFIRARACWAVLGHTEQGNLAFYWARTEDKLCESGKIRARIKAHQVDTHRNNAKVTALNYVKIVKE